MLAFPFTCAETESKWWHSPFSYLQRQNPDAIIAHFSAPYRNRFQMLVFFIQPVQGQNLDAGISYSPRPRAESRCWHCPFNPPRYEIQMMAFPFQPAQKRNLQHSGISYSTCAGTDSRRWRFSSTPAETHSRCRHFLFTCGEANPDAGFCWSLCAETESRCRHFLFSRAETASRCWWRPFNPIWDAFFRPSRNRIQMLAFLFQPLQRRNFHSTVAFITQPKQRQNPDAVHIPCNYKIQMLAWLFWWAEEEVTIRGAVGGGRSNCVRTGANSTRD